MAKKLEDLTGQRFGRLVVLEKVWKNGRNHWKCKCDCGKETIVAPASLRNGKTKSCGCYGREQSRKRRLKDISGQRFGRLIALERTGKMIGTNSEWKCQCDCGNICYKNINSLTQGRAKSCGCLDKENKAMIGQRPKSLGKKNDLTGRRFGKLVVIEDSNKRTKSGNIIWKCQCDCGNIKNITGTHLLCGNTNSCGCINSKGELKIQQILRENNISFIQQYSFNDCINPKTGKKLLFDFYLPDYNRCIEFDGEQHYISREKGYFTEDIVKEIQYRDNIKTKYCKQHNIDLKRILWYNINNIDIQDLIGD